MSLTINNSSWAHIQHNLLLCWVWLRRGITAGLSNCFDNMPYQGWWGLCCQISSTIKITASSQANKIIFFISSYNLDLFYLVWLFYSFVPIVYTQKTKLGTQFWKLETHVSKKKKNNKKNKYPDCQTQIEILGNFCKTLDTNPIV